MAKRERKVMISGVTRDAADEAFATYAKANAQMLKIQADIELQCAKIREQKAVRLSELDAYQCLLPGSANFGQGLRTPDH